MVKGTKEAMQELGNAAARIEAQASRMEEQCRRIEDLLGGGAPRAREQCAGPVPSEAPKGQICPGIAGGLEAESAEEGRPRARSEESSQVGDSARCAAQVGDLGRCGTWADGRENACGSRRKERVAWLGHVPRQGGGEGEIADESTEFDCQGSPADAEQANGTFRKSKTWGEAALMTASRTAETLTENILGDEDCVSPRSRKAAERLAALPRWKRVLRGQRFDLMAAYIVCMNAFTMALELEYHGMQAEALVDGTDLESVKWPGAEWVFKALEHGFCWVFFVEIVLRLLAYGASYFCFILNYLDMIIVFTGLAELYVLDLIGITFPNIMAIRLLRMVKLAKVLRIVRLLRFFRHLRILVVSIVASLGALGWSIVFLSLLQMMAAILMTQLLQHAITDTARPEKLRNELLQHFGRWSYSMLTMFEITIAPGAWGKIGRLLIFQVDGLYAIFFVSYIWGITFAVVRVISALFLKETLAVAAEDEEHSIEERARKRQKEINHLRMIFNAADYDYSGTVSLAEFTKVVQEPRVAHWLGEVGLDLNEMTGLFGLLDDGDGQVSMEEFLAGATRIRGTARSADVVTLIYENRRMMSDLKEALDQLHQNKHQHQALAH